MIARKIASVCFYMAMFLTILLLLNIPVPLIGRKYSILLIVFFGIVAVFINLLYSRTSEHNIIYSIFYWTACLLLILGFAHYLLGTGTNYILFIGIVLMFVSFFIPKYVKKEKNNADLLDDFD